MEKLENAVEKYFKKQAEKNGYLCYKYTAPSTNGVPDRIIIGHDEVAFVELKRPGEKPRPLQLEIIKNMRAHGAKVFVADTKEKVDQIFIELSTPKKGGTNLC